MSTLDPRSPLVLDTRELGRRAGAIKRMQFTVEAPAEFGVPMIGVAQGSPIDFDIRLESVIEGVLVSGTAVVTVRGECSRCLEALAYDTEVDVQELYEYPETDARGREVESNRNEDDMFKVEGDYLDLEPALRDAVVLALPLSPLCQPDCLGLCTRCGENLNDNPDHEHEEVDSRWAALADLATKDSGDEDR